MKDVKDILKEKLIIEEKLTNSEIEYNKFNFKEKSIKQKIKKFNKMINNSSEEELSLMFNKLDILNEKIAKINAKIVKINSSKNLDKKTKKANLFAQKNNLKKYNYKKLKLNSDIKKFRNLNLNLINKKIKELENKSTQLMPILNSKKEIVNKYRKVYKNVNIKLKSELPDFDENLIISVKDLNIFYGTKQVLFDVNIEFPKNKVIAIIGPSGCGKSTFLKTLNRINDEIPLFNAKGNILFQNEVDILTLKNIYDSSQKITLPELRTKIGMVFQQPNPFPMSIYNNVAYGPRINGIKNKYYLKEIVKKSLKRAGLYDQVEDNLNVLATGLSGGQQQRLCIARAIANKPDVLLMDEPTSALDPIAASKIEDLILQLKKDYTIIMVTHSMQQAARISDKTAFFYQGKLIEYGDTEKIFTKPQMKKTDDYIRGKFG